VVWVPGWWRSVAEKAVQRSSMVSQAAAAAAAVQSGVAA
jgi:hypothetical protein